MQRSVNALSTELVLTNMRVRDQRAVISELTEEVRVLPERLAERNLVCLRGYLCTLGVGRMNV